MLLVICIVGEVGNKSNCNYDRHEILISGLDGMLLLSSCSCEMILTPYQYLKFKQGEARGFVTVFSFRKNWQNVKMSYSYFFFRAQMSSSCIIQ